jgi:hypothetical protein
MPFDLIAGGMPAGTRIAPGVAEDGAPALRVEHAVEGRYGAATVTAVWRVGEARALALRVLAECDRLDARRAAGPLLVDREAAWPG